MEFSKIRERPRMPGGNCDFPDSRFASVTSGRFGSALRVRLIRVHSCFTWCARVSEVAKRHTEAILDRNRELRFSHDRE